MSKESTLGQQCACGQFITFFEQHAMHCKKAVVSQPKKKRKKKRDHGK